MPEGSTTVRGGQRGITVKPTTVSEELGGGATVKRNNMGRQKEVGRVIPP